MHESVAFNEMANWMASALPNPSSDPQAYYDLLDARANAIGGQLNVAWDYFKDSNGVSCRKDGTQPSLPSLSCP
jgi:hypothetical protein